MAADTNFFNVYCHPPVNVIYDLAHSTAVHQTTVLRHWNNSNRTSTSGARHSKRHYTLDCTVLPPGEFNSMIAQPSLIHSEKFHDGHCKIFVVKHENKQTLLQSYRHRQPKTVPC